MECPLISFHLCSQRSSGLLFSLKIRFDAWIRMIDRYSGNDLLYLNAKGIIPAEAVTRRGDRRNNPFREKKLFDATSFPEGRVKAGETALDAEEDEDEEAEGNLDKAKLADMEG